MTVFVGACSVTSCPFNLGDGRVTCGWLRNGRGRCHHPIYREAWALGHELEQAQAAEAAPILEPAPVIPALSVYDHNAIGPARSLTGRALAASKPMDAARARQMLLDLGEV
jgi:hypothetical protein